MQPRTLDRSIEITKSRASTIASRPAKHIIPCGGHRVRSGINYKLMQLDNRAPLEIIEAGSALRPVDSQLKHCRGGGRRERIAERGKNPRRGTGTQFMLRGEARFFRSRLIKRGVRSLRMYPGYAPRIDTNCREGKRTHGKSSSCFSFALSRFAHCHRACGSTLLCNWIPEAVCTDVSGFVGRKRKEIGIWIFAPRKDRV